MHIDCSDWILLSDRSASKNLISPDQKLFVKIPKGENASEVLTREKLMSEAVYSYGINTPKVLDIVETSDGCEGILFENIENKTSLAKVIYRDKTKLKYYMQMMADMAHAFHNTKADPQIFCKVEDKLFDKLEDFSKHISAEQVQAVKCIIDETPKVETLIHGDLHLGNFIVDSKDQVYAIDVGSACIGNPVYDIASYYFFTHGFERVQKHYLTPEDCPIYWNSFKQCYFGREDIDETGLQRHGLISLLLHWNEVPPLQKILPLKFDTLGRIWLQAR